MPFWSTPDGDCASTAYSRNTYAIGRDQIVIFLITAVAILATDLLFGILTGVAAEIVMLAYLLSPSFRVVLTGRLTFSQSARLVLRNLVDLIRSTVIKVKHEEHSGIPHYEITLGSVVCFNLLPLDKLLQSLPGNAAITLAASESGHIIDHTAMEYLHNFQEECLRAGRALRLVGIEEYYQFTRNYPGIYLEIRDNALLIFRPDRELESTADIEALLRIANLFCIIDSSTAD